MNAALPPISVLASGLVTCGGFNAPATLAALRAGVRAIRETNLWDATAGEYIAAGKVDLPQWWIGSGKWAELVAPAIAECLQAAAPVAAQDIPVMLVLPTTDRPHLPAGVDARLLEEIAFRLDLRPHADSRVLCGDRVATVAALAEAQRWLAAHPGGRCVVAGVDSFIEPQLVQLLLKQRRVLSGDSTNGFSPAEAGAAVLVAGPGHGFPGELAVLGWGLGREAATPSSDEPLRGDGLIAAIEQALQAAGLTMFETDFRISDLNGEHDRFKEMALATLRFERHPRADLHELWHPAEFIGEVGASIGPLLLAVALHAGQHDHGVGPTALCTLSNDDGARGCIVTRYLGAVRP